MKIKVYGKTHREGTNRKTGKPYNFNAVYYLGKVPDVEGNTSEQLFLDPAEYPLETIHVGKEYNVEFNQRGYVVEFAPV